MKINWFPGHMKKTMDMIAENLKLVDCVVNIVDARAPYSSLNPLILENLKNKAVLVIMNKSDLADKKKSLEWKSYLDDRGFNTIIVNSKDTNTKDIVLKEITNVSLKFIEENNRKKLSRSKIRAMIVGVPNVGKSTLINTLTGKKTAKIGNRPGITRSKQWIKLGQAELLDTPGVLWHKLEGDKTAEKLALLGSISDDVVHIDELCLELLDFLKVKYPDNLKSRYKISDDISDMQSLEILDMIAIKRGFILKANEIDYNRACNIIVDEFRKSLIGRCTLEELEDIKNWYLE